MSKAKEFYKQDNQRIKAEHSRLRKYLLGLSIARLIAFVLIITTIIVFLDQSIYMLGIGVPLILAFFWLLTKYSDKKTEENYAIQRMQLNELELRALEGDYSSFPNGDVYRDAKHAYSEDIDLFGKQRSEERSEGKEW